MPGKDKKPKGTGRKKINANITVKQPSKMKTNLRDRKKAGDKSKKNVTTYMKKQTKKSKKRTKK